MSHNNTPNTTFIYNTVADKFGLVKAEHNRTKQPVDFQQDKTVRSRNLLKSLESAKGTQSEIWSNYCQAPGPSQGLALTYHGHVPR